MYTSQANMTVGITIAPVREKVVNFMLASKAGEELIHKTGTQYPCAALWIQQSSFQSASDQQFEGYDHVILL